MDGRTPNPPRFHWLADAGQFAGVLAAYVLTGKLGLLLPAAHPNVTLLWAPSGIALAAVLLWGFRLWPAIALGAFMVNFTTSATPLAAASIAAGNTLEALVAAWLLRRIVGFDLAMSRVRDVLGLFALAAPLGCAAAATCGALTLRLGGSIDWHSARTIWINWWMGDVMGALLVTPLVLTWARPARCAAPDTAMDVAHTAGPRSCGVKAAEALLLLSAFAAFCQFPFAGWLGREHAAGPLAFLPFPFLIWAALRFAQRGAATLTFLAAVIATHATVRNVGAFAGASTQHGLTYLFLYMAVASMTSMLLAAALAERLRAAHIIREREAILRGLCDSIPMMTGVVDVAGDDITFVSCNRATAEFVGRTEADLVGKRITDFVDSRDSWIERYREARQTQRPVRFDFVQQTSRGHRSLEVVVSHIGTLPEGRSRFSFAAEDVTERRVAELRIHRLNDELRHRRLLAERQRAEEALAEERNLLRTLIDNLPDYVYAKDLDCRFILNNTASARAMGGEPEDAIGKTDFDFHPQELACRYYQDDQCVIRIGRPLVNREELNFDHAGRRRWLLTTKAPLRDRQGNIVGLVGIGHDITERKEMEEELFEAHLMLEQRVEERTEELATANAALEGANSALAAANEELELANGALQAEVRRRQETEQALEEANKAKDQFLAVLSHELRTPLTPVLATVTAMLDEDGSGEAPVGTEIGSGPKAPAPAELRNTLEMIRRNVQLEARLIDDLLDLTRISKGKLQLHCDTVDVHEVLRNSVEICRPDIAAKRLSVAFELRAARHHVHADAARLQQVFWNLIKNAVKFTPDGGRLAFRSEDAENGAVRLRVIDSGIGIEPQVMARIFNPFEQGESSITRKFGGLGLGLVITKAVVEAHGGAILAESRGRGHGACFTVELQSVPAPATSRVESPASDARFDPEPPVPDGLSILLVEDNQDTLRFMSRLLRRVGHRVTTADSLATARQAFHASRAAEHFDLLISDIGLPDGNGLELLPQLRELAAADYPFKAIALSGYGMDEDIEKSRSAGFLEHLTKPIDFQLLEAVIARVTAQPRAAAHEVPHGV